MEERTETVGDQLDFSLEDIPTPEAFAKGYLCGWNMCMSLMYCLNLDGASSFEAYYTARFHWSALHDWVDEGLRLSDVAKDFFYKRPYKGIQGREGYVYILRADNGLCKIGQTKKLTDRIKQLGVQLPYELELVHAIGTDHVTNAEQLLHDRYAEKRKRGEWFALTEGDLDEIKTQNYLYAAAGEEVALWFAGWKRQSSDEEQIDGQKAI